ncbi:MAG: hypothetical protein ACON4W_07625 [Parvibaculales bacterium]
MTVVSAAFLSAVPEIPLAPGMQENAESTLIFDKPEGRIIAIEALTDRPTEEILSYYRAVLPNLGWAPSAKGWTRPNELKFLRSGEALDIRVEGGVVFFKLQPDS